MLQARLQQHQPEPDLKAASVWGEVGDNSGDMCPEKEHYMMDLRLQVTVYEARLHELAKLIHEETQDGSLYRTSLAVHHGEYELAQTTRDLLDMELTATAGGVRPGQLLAESTRYSTSVAQDPRTLVVLLRSYVRLACYEKGHQARPKRVQGVISDDTADGPPTSKLYDPKAGRQQYPHQLVADSAGINSIIDREQQERVDGMDCPENIFVQQALEQLKERREKVASKKITEPSSEPAAPLDEQAEPITESPEPTLTADDSNFLQSDIVQTLHCETSDYFYFFQATDGHLHSQFHKRVRTVNQAAGSKEAYL
ncbi:hypothetical protein pipiens_015562 [Culex pipiens pipiens]|uniref:Uncharacterized protein n=1 Tax=Culex pipiens pipiens TaxID=38569 RepID=A0ABD1CPX5_CULPP